MIISSNVCKVHLIALSSKEGLIRGTILTIFNHAVQSFHRITFIVNIFNIDSSSGYILIAM